MNCDRRLKDTSDSDRKRTVAVDVYNQTIDGEVAASVTAATGGQTQAAQR